MKAKVTVNCQVCGKPHEHPVSRVKQGLGKFCSLECSAKSQKGRKFPHTLQHERVRLDAVRKAAKERVYPKGYKRLREHVQPMIDAFKKAKENNPTKYRERALRHLSRNGTTDVSGPNSPNWKGGISNACVAWRNKHRKHLEKFRQDVLQRDGHKCKECPSTVDLQAHHILGVAEYPQFAFLRANGVTLCKRCHYKTDNYGGNRVNRPLKVADVTAVFIPGHWQDYPTCGNYKLGTGGERLFLINQLGNHDYEFLVLIHEMIEEHLTRRRGLKEPDIMAFDVMWEKEREEGKHSEDDEPGHDPRAPYNKEHVLAENIERLLAHSMGVDWNAYAKSVMDSCAVTMTT